MPDGWQETPSDGVWLTKLDLGSDQILVLSVATEPGKRLNALTPAEKEVAALLLRGLSNADIAREREVALRTVANQVASIFKKMNVGSRAELAACLARKR